MSSAVQLNPDRNQTDLPDDVDQRWALVQRVAHSMAMGRSEQLTKLLLYVCRMAISNRGDEISEQRIGVDVFGRTPDYDPGIDGIVRSHATRLRHRLELYFGNEGANEPLVIDIPRGGYVPYFVPRLPGTTAANVALCESQQQPISLDTRTEAVAADTEWFRHGLKAFLAGMAVAAVLGICVYLVWGGSWFPPKQGVEQSRIEHQFWSTIFPPKGRTLLVPGDSGLVMYSGFTNQDITLSDYISGTYRDPQRAKTLDDSASQALLLSLASRRYTSMVDQRLISQLTHLPEWHKENAETIFARDLVPASAQDSNLILIGSRQANPWVSLVEPAMNFVLIPDGNGGFKFLNRHPRAGESPTYSPSPDGEHMGLNVVYGQVAYLPNPSGQGMVLVLGGLWMSGTQSAGNFVLSGHQFAEWLHSIQQPDGSIPPFELLIQTKNLGGSAEASTILTSRVLRK